jgi:fimbrial isopeptide formation D2 family protein/LPXTG-motif cell wall-anchored protein
MKKFTKLLGIVLIMALVMSMGIMAFADGETTHTITITQPTPSDGTAGAETYEAYRIFTVKKTDSVTEPVTSTPGPGTATGFSYSIATTDKWFSVLGSVNETTGAWTAANGQTWVTLTKANDGTYNVTWAGANTAAAANDFAKWLLANKGSITYDYQFSSDGATAEQEVIDGYYMITSTLGTNLVAATTDITINTKNEYITDNKTVETSHYNVGDHVAYTITVNLPASIDYTKPVIVHDTMDDVLKYDTDSLHAKVTEANDFDSHITYVASSAFDDDHDDEGHATAEGKVLYDFVLDISSLAPASGAEPAAKTITITYTAELLSTALADTGYVNKEFVEYSKYKTTPNDTIVKTYDFDLEKTFTGSTDTTLEATFNLYPSVTTPAAEEGGTATTSKDSTPISLVEETKYEKYVKADSDDATTTTTITAKLGTTLNVRGLDAGKYYLTELTTADGYNLLTQDIVINIDAEGNATVEGAGDLFSASGNKITVVNNSGTVLPSTGGIGTTIFYVVGSILVVAAGVLLITKKRMSREG